MSKLLVLLICWNSILFAEICKKEFSKYPELIKDGWSIRIEPQIDLYGCKVIKIFNLLVKKEAVGIMDAIDEQPEIMQNVLKLFKHREFVKLMNTNKTARNLIDLNSGNPKFLKNLNYLIQYKYNSAKGKKVSKDISYLNYYILPSIHAKNSKELKKYYHALKKLNLEELKIFTLVYATIGDSYDFTLLIENFSTLKNKLTKKELNLIIQYPKYIVYFLYPSKEEMGINKDKKYIHKKQKQYQEIIISFYKSLYRHNKSSVNAENANYYALFTLEEIQPYMVAYPHNYYELGKLLQTLVKQNLIDDLWKKVDNSCNKKNKGEVFAIFGDNNLKNLLKIKDDENDLYKDLMHSSSNQKNIASIFYISNVYAKFTPLKWSIFRNLLYTLPTPSQDFYMNSFVLKNLDNMHYFDNVTKKDDYNIIVKKDSDVQNGISTVKYKYILLTSYPSDEDPSVFQYIGSNNLDSAKENLAKLYKLPIDELESHNFTDFEKSMAFINKADWALTGVAVIAAPFTGGVSLSYIAVKQTGKIAAKKGMKYYAKKLSVKLVNKSIRFARHGRKSLFKNLGEKNTRVFGKGLDKVDNIKENFIFGAGAVGYFAMPTNIEAKDICQK